MSRYKGSVTLIPFPAKLPPQTRRWETIPIKHELLPARSIGPQYPDMADHVAYQTALDAVIEKKRAEDDE